MTSNLPPLGILPPHPSCVGSEATLLLRVQVSEAGVGFGGQQWIWSLSGYSGSEGQLPWMPSTSPFCHFFVFGFVMHPRLRLSCNVRHDFGDAYRVRLSFSSRRVSA
jgi:hypothetical protein